MTHPTNPDGEVIVTDEQIDELVTRYFGTGRYHFAPSRYRAFARKLLSAAEPAAIDREATKPNDDYEVDHGTHIERVPFYNPDAAPSVEQDERGALLNELFDRQQAGFDRCFEALGITDDRERNWSSLVMAINDLVEARAASTSANVAQGAPSVDEYENGVDEYLRVTAQKLSDMGYLWQAENLRRAVGFPVEDSQNQNAKVAQGAEAPWEMDWPEYSYDGMGCGLEDRNITDRYEAMKYGWDEALERVGQILERDGPLYAAPPAQPVLAVTPAMVKAAMPWLTGLHHMRKTDKESNVEEAIKAALTAAQSASGDAR